MPVVESPVKAKSNPPGSSSDSPASSLGRIFLWRSAGEEHSLVLSAREGKQQERGQGFLASAEFDRKILPRLEAGESLELPGGLDFAFTGLSTTGIFDLDVYRVKVEGLVDLTVSLRIAHPLLQTLTDAETHINIQFNTMKHTPNVHGVMGQTFRPNREQRELDFAALGQLMHRPIAADGPSGKGFLDGETMDYETSSLYAADCQYSTFHGRSIPKHSYYVDASVA
jgi:hypothetical protein